MSNEKTSESKEQEQQTESVVEDSGDVVETQLSEVIGDVENVKKVSMEDVSRIEENGLPEEVQEMGDITERTTEEAEEAREEYEEQIKSIPNFDDKVKAIEKETEASEETQEELKEAIGSMPNLEDKQKSLKRESMDRNELINNIKQTIEDRFSNVSPKDCQALSGFAEYTALLEYLDTREGDIEDSKKMKGMDTHQKIEYMQSLCGQCLYEIANNTQVRDFFNENGSNLSSGNNKLDEVIKSVFSIVEHS